MPRITTKEIHASLIEEEKYKNDLLGHSMDEGKDIVWEDFLEIIERDEREITAYCCYFDHYSNEIKQKLQDDLEEFLAIKKEVEKYYQGFFLVYGYNCSYHLHWIYQLYNFHLWWHRPNQKLLWKRPAKDEAEVLWALQLKTSPFDKDMICHLNYKELEVVLKNCQRICK